MKIGESLRENDDRTEYHEQRANSMCGRDLFPPEYVEENRRSEDFKESDYRSIPRRSSLEPDEVQTVKQNPDKERDEECIFPQVRIF